MATKIKTLGLRSRTAKTTVLIAAILSCGGCGRQKSVEQKQKQTHVDARGQSQSGVSPEALAMAAVFGAHTGEPTRVGRRRVIFREGKLLQAGGKTILIVGGTAVSAAHSDPGYLGIWYLDRQGGGFVVGKSVPDAIEAGTFGDPPNWHVRNDLGSAPVLVVEGFGQWFGHAFTCSTLLALEPDGPRRLTPPILTAYSFDPGNDLAVSEPFENFEGEIHLEPDGKSLTITYRGTIKETVSYRRAGNQFKEPLLRHELKRC